MEEISHQKFKKAMAEKPEEEESKEIENDKEFEDALDKMNNPIDSLKSLAVKIKLYLDKKIEEETNSGKGVLTDHTRRWVETFEKILEKIQKALHGDKSVNLHIHEVSHGEIGAKIRESKLIVFGEKEKEKKKEKEK